LPIFFLFAAAGKRLDEMGKIGGGEKK